MKKGRLPKTRTALAWAGIILVLSWNAGTCLGSDFLPVLGPCGFSFPKDHGAHPGYQTEWWYYTGHLNAEGGRPFGFQLTFFRRQIVSSDATAGWPSQPSSWRTQNLFMAHAALSDIADQRFYWDEDVARGAVGLAGVNEGIGIDVFLGRWIAGIAPTGHHLKATTDAFSFDLMAMPRKAPTAHGRGGYSRKGVRPESASCYYSLTRLNASGALMINGRIYNVHGTAWMDHEYSTAPLEPFLVGWDWFSIQFEDHTELMIYILREKDGSWTPASSGTFVPVTGEAMRLGREDIQVAVTDRWKSPHSRATYPCRWHIRVLPLQLDVEIVPRLSDQELRLSRSMQVSYWEGSVKVKGHQAGRAIKGLGYVELTGYAAPFDLLAQEPR